jgi:hypothetical protein
MAGGGSRSGRRRTEDAAAAVACYYSVCMVGGSWRDSMRCLYLRRCVLCVSWYDMMAIA